MNALVAATSLLLVLASGDERFDFKGDTEVSAVRWEEGLRTSDAPGVTISFTLGAVARLAAAMKARPGEAFELTLDGIYFARQLPGLKASDNWVLVDLSPALRARLKQIKSSRK
jgi:hypothetical protein